MRQHLSISFQYLPLIDAEAAHRPSCDADCEALYMCVLCTSTAQVRSPSGRLYASSFSHMVHALCAVLQKFGVARTGAPLGHSLVDAAAPSPGGLAAPGNDSGAGSGLGTRPGFSAGGNANSGTPYMQALRCLAANRAQALLVRGCLRTLPTQSGCCDCHTVSG